jgi:RHS repeat-associated protein
MRFRLPAHLIHVAVAVTVAVAGLPAAAAAQTAPPGQHPPAANAAAANAASAPGPREFFYDAAGQLAGTGADGRFALAGLPSGHLALRVDGRSTTGTARGTYGVFDIGVDVTHGEVLVLPYTVFLPKIDVRATVSVPSPTAREIVLTTKAIPGLEVHIPKGTVIRDADGNVAHELSLTPIPIDRPPFPLPPTRVPVYFSVQPGGGVLFPEGARIVYPNYTREAPGTRTQFWNYDPDVKGWHLYGLGTVTPDGKQIVPDPDVKFYRLTGAMTAVPGMNPAQNAPRPNGARVGDPVDPSTGLLVDEAVDLTVDDIVPIEIKRTYQQGDVDTRAFGVGTNFDYGLFPWSPGQIGNFDFQQFDLVQPDGSKIHYSRTSPGNDYAGAIFKADPTPTRYDGSTVAWNGDGWDVKLRDGTVYVLGDESPVQEIRDKFGNTTTITRATAAPGTDGKVRLNGAVTQITSPNGRWVKFSYDQANPPKITSIEDSIGRKVGYTYDTGNRLSTVTDTRGGVTRYAWENGLLKGITDPRGTEYLVNTYDANKRVKTQKGPDGGLITFDYVTSGTAVTETTMTDPEGNKRRFTFNAQGQVLTDTKAYGTSLAQTTTTTYDTSGVRRAATVDALNRRTAYTYNAAGQVNKITVLDGTAQARSETFDWTGPYAELTRHTDGYGKATVYEIDGKGYLKSVTDRQNRKSLVTTDAAGQVTRLTDPAGKAVTTVYAGSDAVQTTDEAGNVSRTAYDGIGRPVRAAGNRLRRTEDSVSGVVTTDYDDLDRITGEGTPQGSVAHSYTAAVRDRTLTVAGRTATRHLYDANGALQEIQQGGTAVTTVGRDVTGRAERVGAPSTGISQTYAYTDAGQVKTITYRNGTTVLGDLGYEYDAAGRPIRVTGTYSRTALPPEFGPATYDAANRIEKVADTAVTHDADGNITSDGVTTYTWNARGELAALSGADRSASFTYATDGRRTGRTVDGATTTYLYDGTNPLQESVNGAVAATMTSAGTDGFQLRESGGTTRRYLTDALGSTVGLVDTTGAGAAYSYEPFGATTVTGTDNGNPYRYTGREDDGTGLYFYRERYYSPVLQRFLSEDPIGFAGGLNLYAYVSNQPTLLTDPTGEKPANPGGGSGGTGDDGYIPGYYLLDKGFKAPKQTTPGTRIIEGTYNNNRGPGGERQEPWTAHYDQYGRLIGRTDYNAGLPGQGIPDTHYHRFVYGPGKNGHEIEKHVPGEFTP